MKDVLRTKKDGYVYGPEKPGLGVEVNWDRMGSKCIHSIYCDTREFDDYFDNVYEQQKAHQTWLKVQTNSFNYCLKTYV